MELKIAAIKNYYFRKRYKCLNLLKKEKLKVHFCFQKRNGGDMDTEEIALLFIIDQMIVFLKDEKVNIRLDFELFDVFVDFT